MKRFITIASILALVGGVSQAQEAMDEKMEAKAPSVSVSAVGEFGFKHVDKDSEPDAENLHLIRQYQVNFSSQGTTDGGLVFGGGISIEGNHGENKGESKVNGSNVYIGGADGTWKLKLGGNDPGIDVAGIIGVASEDGMFDGGDSTDIGFEGAFGGTSYRITMADPQEMDNSQGDGDWSAGARHSLGEYSIGLGMDSEGGLAFGLGATLSGVGLEMVYSKADESMFDLMTTHTSDSEAKRSSVGAKAFAANQKADANDDTKVFAADDSIYELGTNYGSMEYTGLGISASMSAGEGATFSLSYSQREGETQAAAGNYILAPTASAPTANTPEAITAAQNVVASLDTEVTKFELGVSYDLGGGATLKGAVKQEEHESTGTIRSKTAGKGVVSPNADSSADISATNPASASYTESDTITTLELKIAFSF